MAGCIAFLVIIFLLIISLIVMFGIVVLMIGLTAFFLILGVAFRKDGKKIGYLFFALSVIFLLLTVYWGFSILGPEEETIETSAFDEATITFTSYYK